MIKIENLEFEYFDRDEEGNLTDMIDAIRGINFDVDKGEFVAICGRNGSGKSTFAKILNGLFKAVEGTVNICGFDANEVENLLEIRKNVGMVFQNPDDQLIGSIVEEDIAFGMENLGVKRAEMDARVDEAIYDAGLVRNADLYSDDINAKSGGNLNADLVDNEYRKMEIREARKRKINELSGGEKQKVSIATVLAMKPKVIVLDEATSMLDPTSRAELLKVICKINKENKVSVVMVTHIMEEAFLADKMYVFDKGRIAIKGRPIDVFADRESLVKLGLERPLSYEIGRVLLDNHIIKRLNGFGIEDIICELKKEYPGKFWLEKMPVEALPERETVDPKSAILYNHVSFSYDLKSKKISGRKIRRRNAGGENKEIAGENVRGGKNEIAGENVRGGKDGSGEKNVRGGKDEFYDVRDVSLSIKKGEYVVMVGRTGSGKSTLLQMIPALDKPTDGQIYVDGIDVNDRTTDIRKLRTKIGYLFQYPEQQLFGDNVYEDVVFGARNVGIKEIQAEKQAYEAIEMVGLPQAVYDLPLYKLSGGQRRRVALAGVIAMKPEYLILDEPTSGLDPEGRRELLDIIDILHEQAGMTILIVSHDIDNVAMRADRVCAMDEGRIIYSGKPANAFYKLYQENGDINQIPTIMQLLVRANEEGLQVNPLVTDVEQGLQELCRGLS